MSLQNLEPLLQSRRALVLGIPANPLQFSCLDQLQETALDCVQIHDAEQFNGANAQAAVLVVFDASLLDAERIVWLAQRGCRGVIWASNEAIDPELLRAARPHRLRFIGPRSAGCFHAAGLRAGAFPTAIAPGGLALIAQSGSIAAAAVDWAVGRGIGFSWTVTTGAEADADVADFLDVAALDPRTRAVILQVGRLRNARKFMSAARACSRLKPVVVLQSRVGGRDGLSGPDPVRSAAFARAGLVECPTLDGLFDALTAMAHLPERTQARVITVGNGAGMCALGVDAVLRHQVEPASCDEAVRAAVREHVPKVRFLDGAVDVGSAEPKAVIEALRGLLAAADIDYVLFMHSPTVAEAHEPYVDALIEARLGPRVVTTWLGLASTAVARRRSIEAGLGTFVTAGQAARALRYRWQYRRTRELLMQTPPAREPREFQRAHAAAIIDGALREGLAVLSSTAADALLDYYDLPDTDADPGSLRFTLEIASHGELGPHLRIMASSELLYTDVGYAFTPIDELIARRCIESMKLAVSEPLVKALAQVLEELAQIVIDQPAVSSLRLVLALNEAGGLVRMGDVHVALQRPAVAESQRLLLAPFPEQLLHTIQARDGRRYTLRPVRPEDEPALLRLLESLRPEDIRLRFFASIRYFSHEMAARMTQIDYDREIAFVAMPEGEPEALCAIAHLVLDPYGEEGEFALLVHHGHTGAGLGRALMTALLNGGRQRGLQRVIGDVLRENGPMLALARGLGFRSLSHPDEPDCRRVVIDLGSAQAAATAAKSQA
jgi:acyl-CoA synthetase (NDP forming)/GNAT superfamily N-acetyltransferase